MKKTKNNKKGFTLLELLVVVLIIGILAAIALPKYKKVKTKAEAKQLILNVKALNEAQHRFYLTNNRYATSFSDLDIEFSGYPNHNCSIFSGHFALSDCYSNDKSSIFISGNSSRSSSSLFNSGKYQGTGFRHNHQKIMCYRWNLDENSDELCTKIFNCTLNTSIGNDANKYYDCPDL